MRINNYAVALTSNYYKLELGATSGDIETNEMKFLEKDEASISKIESNLAKTNTDDSEISIALSKAILQNVKNSTPQSLRDTINMRYTYTESEGLNFQAKAYLKTQDKEMEISLDISLSRSFVQQTTISFESMQLLKDPLILSFDSSMPKLSSQTFAFDIDSDGTKDQISQLSSSSAFLALDKNNNNKIDNGNELFGTQSGNGFADLKVYDADDNGWIDENDLIFEKLRIWKKSEGKDELLGLGEVGIGAIFLGSAQSPFSIKSDTNTTLGEIKSSGFFVYEEGKAGVISQVDLVSTPDTKKRVQTLKEVQKNLASVEVESVYVENSQNTQENSSIEKLQQKLQALEKKLLDANENQKESIEMKIKVIQTQLLSLLTQEIS